MSASLFRSASWVRDWHKDSDDTVSRKEWTALADDWFQTLDTGSTGKVPRADFVAHFNSLLLPPDMRGLGLELKPVLQWPEFNTLIGGYFKFHWPGPQLIYVKIDDPNSPLTAMFHGKEFEIHDETYTCGLVNQSVIGQWAEMCRVSPRYSASIWSRAGLQHFGSK